MRRKKGKGKDLKKVRQRRRGRSSKKTPAGFFPLRLPEKKGESGKVETVSDAPKKREARTIFLLSRQQGRSKYGKKVSNRSV